MASPSSSLETSTDALSTPPVGSPPDQDDGTTWGSAWFGGWACAAIAYLLGATLLPALDIKPASSLRFFPSVESTGILLPEPLEQQRYLLAVLASAAIPLSLLLARKALRRRSRWSVAASLAGQAGLGALVWICFARDQLEVTRVMPWLAGRDLVVLVVALALAAGLVLWRGRGLVAWLDRRLSGALADAAAAVLAGGFALALASGAVNTDASIMGSGIQTWGHVPFTFEEVYAVALGRTPLVDFTPQYSVLSSWLLAPVLSLRSPSVGVFTVAMTALTTGAFLCLYVALRLVTRRPLRALSLFVPAVAISLVPVYVLPGGIVQGLANYFAGLPLRYMGPMAALLATIWAIRRPASLLRVAIVGAVAGAAVLNNVEFGIVAVGASALALALGRAPDQAIAWRSWARPGAAFVAGMVVPVVLLVVATVVKSGELPDPGQLVYFQRQFGTAGFAMLPMDHLLGVHAVVFLTMAAAFATGAGQALTRNGRPGIDGRMRVALLVYTGVFGLGSFAYFVGRSHPDVLYATWLAWSMALVALTWEAASRIHEAERIPWRLLPASIMVFALTAVFGIGGLQRIGYVPDQLNRIRSASPIGPLLAEHDTILYSRRCLPRGTNVMLMVPIGDRVAHAAGLHNWFPYNDRLSLVTYDQLHRTLDLVRSRRVTNILSTALVPEVEAGLRSVGFRPVERIVTPAPPDYGAVNAENNFTSWERTDGPPVARCGTRARVAG